MKNKGCILIELMIIAAVIGILASLVMLPPLKPKDAAVVDVQGGGECAEVVIDAGVSN